MTKKPENSSEFFNNWARTNRDPDGNYVEKYTIGGENDSYLGWIRLKYAEIHQILTEICAEIDEIIQKTQQIELENRKNPAEIAKNVENSGKNTEIEVKSTENPQKYKWISEKTNCFKCKSLDGKIFNHKPNVEEIAHPNCKCEVVEVSEIEAEMAEMEREIEIGKRDESINTLTQNSKIAKFNDKTGKMEYFDRKTNEKVNVGECARYVSNAIVKSFPEYDKIRPTEAKNAGISLEKIGFIKIPEGKNYEPQIGDVKVFQPYPGGNSAGHMQMFDGEQWVSDFKQGETPRNKLEDPSGMFVNPKYKAHENSTIFRHPKW